MPEEQVVHGEIRDIPIDLIDPNEWNPNEMTAEEFNMLSDNIDAVDFLDPVLVVPKGEGRFRIVDGEHRFEAQRLRDVGTIKCIIADPERFDEDTQRFQTVRMNKIKGKMNNRKFADLVSSLMEKGTYSYDQLSHEFGFVNESEFDQIMEAARESLPTDEMKAAFDKAAGDIKTVDDLSLVLNRLFTAYGDTLPYHFMILDFGDKEHIWCRLQKEAYKRIVGQARACAQENVTFDSVLSLIVTQLDVPRFVSEFRESLDEPDPVEQRGENIDDLLAEDSNE